MAASFFFSLPVHINYECVRGTSPEKEGLSRYITSCSVVVTFACQGRTSNPQPWAAMLPPWPIWQWLTSLFDQTSKNYCYIQISIDLPSQIGVKFSNDLKQEIKAIQEPYRLKRSFRRFIISGFLPFEEFTVEHSKEICLAYSQACWSGLTEQPKLAVYGTFVRPSMNQLLF